MNMLEKFKITDRVAIVTGGGQDIGKGIASIFAEAGAFVVISDMIAETVQTTAQELSAQGGNVLATVTDVRDSGQVAQMMKTTMDKFGRIDILVNNAAGNFKKPFWISAKMVGTRYSGHPEKRFPVQQRRG